MPDEVLETEKVQPKVDYTLVNEFGPLATRRKFLMGWLSWTKVAWFTFTGSQLVAVGAMARFMLPNVLFEPPQVFKAGKPEDFDWDKPDEKYKQQYATWIVKLSKDVIENHRCLVALSTVCTHLGCTPNVLYGEQKIKCPCHGSGFRFSGVNFEGPAPRPLERWKVYLDPVDSQIVVDKTKKFQKEKGEWSSPESFIDLSAS